VCAGSAAPPSHAPSTTHQNYKIRQGPQMQPFYQQPEPDCCTAKIQECCCIHWCELQMARPTRNNASRLAAVFQRCGMYAVVCTRTLSGLSMATHNVRGHWRRLRTPLSSREEDLGSPQCAPCGMHRRQHCYFQRFRLSAHLVAQRRCRARLFVAHVDGPRGHVLLPQIVRIA
jgi:hypothetical protein